LCLVDKLDKNIRSKIERYAQEYVSLPEQSLGRRSVEDRVFEYINSMPKMHLRMEYVRHYYAERHKLEKEHYEKK